MGFLKKLPVWSKKGIEPPNSKKTVGWQEDERPPAEYMNWFQNTTYEVVDELQKNAVHKDDFNQKTNELSSQLADIAIPITKFGASTLIIDNTSAIQETINYVSSLGGGKVLIPRGTFNVVAKQETIKVQSNVTIEGVDKEQSIIRIHESSGDWAYLFFHDRKHSSNVTFRNFKIDSNINNAFTVKPVFPNAQQGNKGSCRVLFHLIGRNYTLENMVIINQGIWAIHIDSSNSVIRNNVFINDLSKYTAEHFDQSIIWSGGENNRIENNRVYTADYDSANPTVQPNRAQTAIEFQGHRNYVENNILQGFRNGIIFTASTKYQAINPYDYIVTELGAKNNKINKNTILCYRAGIEIWGMSVPVDSIIKGTIIEGNTIHVMNTEAQVKPPSGIRVYLGNTGSVANSNDGDQIAAIHDMKILNNYIEFEVRNVQSIMAQAETGVNFLVDVEVDGLDIRGNTIVNAGGLGVLLYESENTYSSGQNNNWIQNVNIVGNTFKNNKLPIRIYRNVNHVLIENNVFTQTSVYVSTTDNMLATILSNNDIFSNAIGYKIINNTIRCPLNLKPFYPRYNLMIAYSMYPFSKAMVLEQNTPETALLTEFTGSSPLMVSQDKVIKRTDGILYKPTYTSGATVGTLKASDNTTNVTIVSRITDNMMEVSDATNIKPNQVLKIPFAYFNSGSAVVTSVVGNVVEVGTGQLSLKAGVTNEFVGSVLTYYDSLNRIG